MSQHLCVACLTARCYKFCTAVMHPKEICGRLVITMLKALTTMNAVVLNDGYYSLYR